MTHTDKTYDVIVVGTGAAGSTAAIAAHDAGASVLMLDKASESEAGGNSRVSGGGWAVLDDEKLAATFLRAISGDFALAEDVIEAWAHEVVQNSTWMESIGADVQVCPGFHTRAEHHDAEGSETYRCMHAVGGALGGFAFFDAMRKATSDRGIEMLFDSPVTELVRTGDVVTGVRVETADGVREYAARGGVVLATGGFHANRQMVNDYLRLPSAPIWGTPHSTGDGQRMAQAIGADLWHMGNMMTQMGIDTDGWGTYLSLFSANSFLHVNDDGRRYRNEVIPGRHGHVVDGHGVELHPLHGATMIFDEPMLTAGPLGAGPELLNVGWGLLMAGVAWSKDNTAEVESGKIVKGASLEDLAAKTGLDAENLRFAVETFNRSAVAGTDQVFGRDPNRMAPLDLTGPLYALAVTPMLGWSNGGPRRDGRARVLDTGHEVIAGLYAAGEVSSTYSWGKDGGFHIADALAFGRIAGREAAARAVPPA